MHILWINNLSSFVGGCETYIYNTVKLLKNHGVKSTFLYDPLEKSAPKFLKNFDAAFPIVDLKSQIREIAPDIIYLHQLYNEKDLEILANGNTAIVRFFHDYYNLCLRGHKLPLFSSKPCQNVKKCHCHPLSFTLVRGKGPLGIKIRTLKNFNYHLSLNQKFSKFIVASNFMQNELIENGFNPEKICKIPLYANEADYQTEQRDPNLIVYIGQLVRGKGVDTLLKAITYLPSEVKAFIIGTGRQEEKYKKLAEKLKLKNQVTFLGPLPHNELITWYKRALCTALPHRWPEPFGLVGIESLSHGTPVISTPLGGINEWFQDGITGLATPPDNPKALAENIQKLQNDPNLQKTFSENGRKIYLQKFTPEQHIIKLMQALIPPKRYTVKGGDEIENRVKTILEDVSQAVKKEISPNQYRVLLLMGGYGKAEGGVEFIEGKAHLHNNIDFLMVSRKRNNTKLHSTLENIFAKIIEKYSIGIDFSIISDGKLKRSQPLMIWHDLYYGHDTLLGDPNYIKKLPFSDSTKIPPSDVQELIRNRLSLILINEWMLDKKNTLDKELKRIFIRHVMKAIIGMGDALLYFLGGYHYSYVEKLNRIKSHKNIPEKLKQEYEKAANFRFEPCYEEYMDIDLIKWQNETRELLQKIHLKCEALRLKKTDLSWNNYLEENLNRFNLNEMSQKIKGLINIPKDILGHKLKQKIAFRLMSPKKRLTLIFPFILYDIEDRTTIEKIGNFLESQNTSKTSLREAYLKKWQTYGDKNFYRFVEKIEHE